MRLPLLLALSLVVAGFTSCADHNSSFTGTNDSAVPADNPANNPDVLTGTQKPTETPGETGGGTDGVIGGGSGGGGGGTDGEIGGAGPVPEPSTLLLVGTGLAGVAMLRRRRAANPS